MDNNVYLHNMNTRELCSNDNVYRLQKALYTSELSNEGQSWKIDEHTACFLGTGYYGGNKVRDRWVTVYYHNIHGQVEAYKVASIGYECGEYSITNYTREQHAKKVLDFLVSKGIINLDGVR